MLALHKYRPVANGIRTDHPIPDLPFVDDTHLPIDDPQSVEAVGRRKGPDMWGREDRCPDGGWVAFTTDPIRNNLAWCVRWHPNHGRSVVLYRDEDASSAYMTYWGPPLLFRAGGYWWDGTTWYRPPQIFDRAQEEYLRRPVPAAATITAAHLLATSRADPSKGRVLSIEEVDPDAAPAGRWLDELALWAERHDDQGWLDESVVSLTAPELTADQLISAAQLAAVAEVAPSTLRAYLARGENEVPPPQATIGGRSMWSRPVAEEWAERRRHSSDSAAQAIAAAREDSSLPVGVSELWQRFTTLFFTVLWNNPERRKRWALRWRTEAAVQDVSRDLGWSAAAGLERVIPVYDLAATVRHAVLDELSDSLQLQNHLKNSNINQPRFHGISHQVARTLDWLVRHNPTAATAAIAEIAGEAQRRLNISRDVTMNSIATALSLDGKLDDATYTEFLDRVLPAEH